MSLTPNFIDLSKALVAQQIQSLLFLPLLSLLQSRHFKVTGELTKGLGGHLATMRSETLTFVKLDTFMPMIPSLFITMLYQSLERFSPCSGLLRRIRRKGSGPILALGVQARQRPLLASMVAALGIVLSPGRQGSECTLPSEWWRLPAMFCFPLPTHLVNLFVFPANLLRIPLLITSLLFIYFFWPTFLCSPLVETQKPLACGS